MWNIPSKEMLHKIPKLYETENIPLKSKLIYLHFFIAGCDWFIAEYDGDDLFWGFAILNNDCEMGEWGYMSFKELKSIKVTGWLEVDCETEDFWKVRKASEVEKIRICQGWPKENGPSANSSKEDELMTKIKAGQFQFFQDLFAEVTNPYSDYFSIDPYPLWCKAHERDEAKCTNGKGETEKG